MVTRPKQPHSSVSREDERAVAGLIARLLLHYWTPQDLPDGARASMAQDWLDDLREFGPESVAEACGEWRRTQNRRPTPSDIRRLAIEAQRNRRADDEPLALPSPEVLAARAERARMRDREMQLGGRAIVTEWARERGFDSIEAYAEANGIHWSEAYGRVVTGILTGSPIAGPMQSVAAQLGVTAREYSPTAEQLAAGRRELGLEPDDGAASAA